MIKTITEKLLFLYKFTRDPRQIGSVAPSSAYLARRMIAPVPWRQVKTIAELGAGTGPITRMIEAVKQAETKLLLFERDPYLRDRLVSRFPDSPCYPDACKLRSALQQEGLAHVDCILSGLPFFNFPQVQREQLMEQIVSSLKPGGLFIAFQYSWQMRNQLSQRFTIEQMHFVPMNLPPAFVYVCRKKEHLA